MSIREAYRRAITQARERILLTNAYFLPEIRLLRALIAAARRGVDVRVVLDKKEAFQKYGKLNDMRRAKVPVRLMAMGKTGDDQQIRFHHKFMIVDREVVCTGSFNWTQQADESNWENEVIFASKKVAAEFKEQFEKAWTGAEEEKEKAPAGPSTPPRKGLAPDAPEGAGG